MPKQPASIRPMLATLTDEPFDSKDWIFEMKLDGYRIIAHLHKGKVKLHTRNLKDYSTKYYPITEALQKWKVNAIVDGEVCVLNDKGVSVFNDLQNWNTDADGPLYYYVFDILWYNGKDLTGRPLEERRNLLRSLVPKSDTIIFSDDIPARGRAFFKLARKQGLEGIIAKKCDSVYRPGERTRDWLKIKTAKTAACIVCGYTRNEGSGKLFSSLVLGAFNGKELVYVGQVGTGFTDRLQKEILRMLKPLVRKKPPFKDVPDLHKGGRWRHEKPELIVWCRPALVCEIQYLEITVNGDLRHQSFIGLREDKEPGDVIAPL